MHSIRGREFSNKSFFKFPLEWIILRVVEDGGNNWRKSSLAICPDVLLKHKKPWGSTFCRVGAGMKLFSACWGLCVMRKMTYSPTYMALYSPCLKVFHPMDLAFSSKVKTCKKWPQLETRVVLPQNAFTYHKSHISYEERQSQKCRSHPCAWHHFHWESRAELSLLWCPEPQVWAHLMLS